MYFSCLKLLGDDSSTSISRKYVCIDKYKSSTFELCLVSGERPWLVSPSGRISVGGGHLDTGSGPEPSVDTGGLEIFTITTLEVAQATRGPDVGQILYNKEKRRGQKICHFFHF